MPKSLLEIQQLLQDAVLNQLQSPPAIAELVSTPRVDAGSRLEIYQEAYRLRLIEALENDFPALRNYWGAERFKLLMREYVENNSSTNSSLRWYGKNLGRFLEERTRDFTFAAELANFEWTIGLAFDAANDEILTASSFATIPPEAWQNLRLQLHASVHFISCDYNTAEVWHALINEKEKPSVEKTPSKSWIAVWRNQYTVRYRIISALEAETLMSFSKGETFGELLTYLASGELGNQAPNNLVTWLREWLASEWITRVSIDK